MRPSPLNRRFSSSKLMGRSTRRSAMADRSFKSSSNLRERLRGMTTPVFRPFLSTTNFCLIAVTSHISPYRMHQQIEEYVIIIARVLERDRANERSLGSNQGLSSPPLWILLRPGRSSIDPKSVTNWQGHIYKRQDSHQSHHVV